MTKKRLVLMICAFAAAPTLAAAQSIPYVGETRTFAYDFCPAGWLEANGRLLDINGNDSLFALIGTIYGGDGQTTFALPDLRGRAMIHYGQGPGLLSYTLGEMAGVESVTLLPSQMPAHLHPVPGAASPPAVSVPTATKGSLASVRTSAVGAAANTSVAGGGQPHENRQPYIAMINCVATEGIFPSQI